MIYKNPHYKRVRGSFRLMICCGFCEKDIALYQKVGKGGLLRMYIERIVKSSIDLSGIPGALFCPSCKEQLATRVVLKRKNTTAYVMRRSTFIAKTL